MHARTATTELFRDRGGARLAGSIAEAAFVRLGGLPQWVMIRGENRANPPLILLHGGPGLSETFFFRHFNAPLEESFTVVYWDQRGSGKSFRRDIPRASMTVEQFLWDLDELVDAVCTRLGSRTVTLFGHSWGSALGVLYAARYPHKVAAYVGSGQVGDWPAAEAASYAFVLAQAQRIGNARAVERLRAIGPPPYGARELWVQRTWLNRIEGHLDARTMWQVARMVLRGPERSLADVPALLRGFRFSIDAMWPEVSRLDLTKRVPELHMPVFFFLGRHDHWVPPQTSVAYFEALAAPWKKLVWFEESGHEPFADEPDKFNRRMVQLVRPLVA